jgi:diguanylate cyclase (GGDEF)-like protein
MKLRDLTDTEQLQHLCTSFSDMSGITTAILELDGEILVAAGWKSACTNFHRVNPITARRCLESDTIIASDLNAGHKYNVYRCKNGLVDVAVPIIVRGEHIANLFTGQFFFEAPDLNQFCEQAKAVGFDEQRYITAINEVPVFTEAKVKLIMRFLRQLAELIGEIGQVNLMLEKQKAEIEKQAIYDALTGLPNRILLQKRAEEVVARAERSQRAFACLFIDLDNFKSVNDNLGHDAGDQLLIEAATRIRNSIREYDLVARFGGDEFVVIAGDLNNKEAAGMIAHNINNSLQVPFTIQNKAFHLSSSIGIAFYPNDCSTISELFKLADNAMYTTKQNGKSGFNYCVH